MGLFPYECIACGGAYERCGSGCKPDDDNGCGGEGGQFCWEDRVVCVPDKLVITNPESNTLKTLQYIFDHIQNIHMYGIYTGYGTAKIPTFDEKGNATIIELCEDNQYASNENYIVCRMWCASCFKG